MQKTRKRFDGEQEKSMAASIECFPDDILVHILSFMSTEACVRSSILGKRWRFLWARVPNLKFDSRDHKTVTSFSNFFNRFVFTHKGHNINSFRFRKERGALMESSENKIEIEKLLATAIACNVQVFHIFSDIGFMLPRCLFTCKTLVDLELFDVTLVDLTPIRFCENNIPMTSTALCLPALKKLGLASIKYESRESLVHLLSGCPALDKLAIFDWDAKGVRLYISSPTLTMLNFNISFYSVDDDEDEVSEVKLDTPALSSLRLHDYVSKDFSAGMLASLTEANVVFEATIDMGVLYPRSAIEFVGKLNNVSTLTLETRWKWMEVPDSAFSALTTEFRNLTELDWHGDCRFVTYFLENSENLEVLSIKMVNDFQYWMEPKQVPVCLIYHLGTVSFFDFKYSEPEFNMVKYILRNAKVLKMMMIYVTSESIDDVKKKYEALQRISMFERASEACKLAFR